MNGYNSGTEPCWMPLMELIETCLFDIIHTEDTTGRFIRLYGAGDYWHAFEESAYQLSQLFVTHDVTVLRHKVYPFPVLMVSISDDELQAYGKNHIFAASIVFQNVPLKNRCPVSVRQSRVHIFRKKVSGYRELVGIGISMKRYKEWHKKEVMKFSSLP